MLRMTAFDALLHGMPELFLFLWGTAMLSHVKVKWGNMLLSTMVATIGLYLIRLLPIQLGVNSFLGVPLMICLSTCINKIPTKKSVSTIILFVAIEFVCEAINLGILKSLNINIDNSFSNQLQKELYTAPSLILFFLAIITANIVLKMKSKSRKTDIDV